MATLEQLYRAAHHHGFTQTACAHLENHMPGSAWHVTYDYPRSLDEHEQRYATGPFYRVHIKEPDKARGETRPVVHIAGTGVGTRSGHQRVSIKNAIDFIRRNGNKTA
jgi:hypothetical protein